MAVHGRVGGDDQDVAGFEAARAAAAPGSITPRTGTGTASLNGVESQGAGGVAGDHEELRALFADQELRAFGGVAGDGAARLGAVGQPGGVADEGEAGVRQPRDECAQNGEPAEAGIEDADGGRVEGFWSRPVSFGWCGFGGEVGAGEVGVAGEGGPRLAIDQESYLGDAGQVGAQRGADGEHGQGFGFKARGMAGDEGAGEVDDGEFDVGVLSSLRRATGMRKTWATEAAPPGTGWVAFGRGIEIEQLAQHGAGAGTGIGGQRQGVHLRDQ